MILFFIIFLILFLFDFKKGVLIFTPFKFFFTSGVILWGNISFDNAISLLICTIFIFQHFVLGKYNKEKNKWPLLLSFFFLAVSESISALIGESPNFISIPLKICRNYGYVLVLFQLIESPKDFSIIIKSLSFYILLLVGNGILEFIFLQNFIGDWVASHQNEDAFWVDYIETTGRGVRINSFLAHSICFGNVCAIFLLIFSHFFIKGYEMKRSVFIIILLVIGVLLSNSRTPLLATLIYIIPILGRRSLFKRYTFFYVLGFFAFLVYLGAPIMQLLDSMFNEHTNYDVGGSNMTMRLEQLTASLDVVSKSLIWGLGFGFDYTFMKDLRGAESIWFNILIFQGLVGVLCYLFMFYEAIFKTKKYSNYIYILFMSIGYLVQQTSTYNANLNDFLFYFCLIILIKYSLLIDRVKFNPTLL